MTWIELVWMMRCQKFALNKFLENTFLKFRSIHSQLFFKIGVLKNFRNTHSKAPVLESLFNKVVVLKVCSFMKKETPPQLFFVNIVKYLKTAFSMKNFPWLLLKMIEEFLRNSNLTLRRSYTKRFVWYDSMTLFVFGMKIGSIS